MKRNWELTIEGADPPHSAGCWISAWDLGFFDGPDFYSHEEVEVFIAELRETAERAFGPRGTIPVRSQESA